MERPPFREAVTLDQVIHPEQGLVGGEGAVSWSMNILLLLFFFSPVSYWVSPMARAKWKWENPGTPLPIFVLFIDKTLCATWTREPVGKAGDCPGGAGGRYLAWKSREGVEAGREKTSQIKQLLRFWMTKTLLTIIMMIMALFTEFFIVFDCYKDFLCIKLFDAHNSLMRQALWSPLVLWMINLRQGKVNLAVQVYS